LVHGGKLHVAREEGHRAENRDDQDSAAQGHLWYPLDEPLGREDPGVLATMHPRNDGHRGAVRLTHDLGQWELDSWATGMFLADPAGGQPCHLGDCCYPKLRSASSDCV